MKNTEVDAVGVPDNDMDVDFNKDGFGELIQKMMSCDTVVNTVPDGRCDTEMLADKEGTVVVSISPNANSADASIDRPTVAFSSSSLDGSVSMP